MSVTLHLCAYCGSSVPPRPTAGRPRRYCSGACRTAAYRDRQAAEFYAEPLPLIAAPPDTTVRAELLEVADALVSADRSAPPEDQLVRAVIEGRTLARALRRLEPLLPKGLAWRAGEAGSRLDETLDELFPLDEPRTER